MWVINEDNSHFFFTRSDAEMTLEGLHGLVDGYAGSKVTHLFFSPNSMRTSYRSAVRDAIWDPVDGRAPDQDWARRACLLHERGLDPYSIWMERSRERGISPWISVRMNDVHNAPDRSNYMHSEFWRHHPEFQIVPHAASARWQDYALDYRYPEVRRHQMQLVAELLERYDMDGLELDWMRFGYHFPPEQEREYASILEAFMEEVHQRVQDVADRRGHPIKLGVRVPSHPDAALGLGMDAVIWAARGWIDLLVPCPFWRSSDFDIPLELWRERLSLTQDGKMPLLLPGLEFNTAPFPGATQVVNDLKICHGFAASAYARGADGIYLFNWMDSQTRPVSKDDYRLLLQRGLEPSTVGDLPRRHPVAYRDTVPAGFPDGAQLPLPLGSSQAIHIHAGPAPRRAGARMVIGLDGLPPGEMEPWRLCVNENEFTCTPEEADTSALGGNPRIALSFSLPPDALRDGENTCAVWTTPGDSPLQIVWAELAYP